MLELKKRIDNDSSIKIGSNNTFRGDSAIGENAKIIKNVQYSSDNSIINDIDMENVAFIEKASVEVVINKYGMKKITLAGAVALISGFVTIFGGIDSILGRNHIFSWLPDWIPMLPQKFSTYFIVGGLIFVLFGGLLIYLVRYKYVANNLSRGT